MPIIAICFVVAKVLVAIMLWYKYRLASTPPSPSTDVSADQANAKLTENHVCVQLPIYNEAENIKPLLKAVSQLSWPRKNLEIQILDDSTDQTTALIEAELRGYRLRNPDLKIQHIRRSTRQGFKAGALEHGMRQTSANFFAILDCDFRPEPDFLLRLMPRITCDPNIAACQARWTYTNGSENLLTRIQQLMLNHHFIHEQQGRYRRGLYFNFNGTAGIWRRSAITNCGGWRSDTVTEDLILSYRAQLKGYRLVYCNDITCASLLPTNLKCFLIQQRRWAKGNGQVLRLLSREIIKSTVASTRQKLDMFGHLIGYGFSSIIVAMFLASPYYMWALISWYQETSYYELPRLLDTCLWLAVFGGFVRIFANKSLSITTQDSIFWRIVAAFGLLLATPLLALLIIKSYWQGVFRTFNPIHQIFNRTPKGRTTGNPIWQLSKTDLVIACSAILITALSTIVSFRAEFYAHTILFSLQIGIALAISRANSKQLKALAV